jgi:hypothetical protein
MKPVVWFRITAVVILLFAVGHTFGFLAFRPSTTEGRAVWLVMNSVRFAEGHSTFSYGGFYVGFGLFITAFQLFAAWFAWLLGSMAQESAPRVCAIAWGMFTLQLVEIGLSLRYFSGGPAVLSAMAAASLAMAAVSHRRSAVAIG